MMNGWFLIVFVRMDLSDFVLDDYDFFFQKGSKMVKDQKDVLLVFAKFFKL